MCACCSCLSFCVLKLRLLRTLTDCRDLIRRMLQADPAVRASLDEVLAHRWMNPVLVPRNLPSAYKATKTTYAALRWPEKVDHLFRAPEDAWRYEATRRDKYLANILELVALLCEAPDTQRPHLTGTPPVLLRLRGCALLQWTSFLRALKGGHPAKHR